MQMSVHGQRGQGRFSLFVSLAVAAAAIFIAVKVIPVRITAYNFRDVLREEVRMGAVRADNAAVKRRILEQAEDLNIPLNPKNLKVQRNQRQITISASYEQPIDFKVTTYVYKFRATEKAPLF